MQYELHIFCIKCFDYWDGKSVPKYHGNDANLKINVWIKLAKWTLYLEQVQKSKIFGKKKHVQKARAVLFCRDAMQYEAHIFAL